MEIIKLNTAAPASPERSILMVYTGGTLGMIRKDPHSPLTPLNFEHLQKNIPELSSLRIDLGVYAYSPPLDSSYIGPSHWIEMASIIASNYDSYDGFVVLHGTDTMAYSASCLSFLLQNLRKPVIFTGAQLPIGYRRTDARNNILTALEIASDHDSGMPKVPEVSVYFDYVLFRGNRASKIESNYFDAYKSENYPALANVGVSIDYFPSFIRKPEAGELNHFDKLDTKIEVIKVFPGMRIHPEKFIDHNEPSGVILESYGSGNIPDDPNLIRTLEILSSSGIPVLNLSQCPGGEVDQGRYEASRVLNEIGVLNGRDMTFEAGLTKMMFCLGNFSDVAQASKMMIKPLAGEIKD